MASNFWNNLKDSVINTYDLSDQVNELTYKDVVTNKDAVVNTTDITNPIDQVSSDNFNSSSIDDNSNSNQLPEAEDGTNGNTNNPPLISIKVYEIRLGLNPMDVGLIRIQRNGVIRITAEPKMPLIGFQINYDQKRIKNISLSLEIRYRNEYGRNIRDTTRNFAAIRRQALDEDDFLAFSFDFGNTIVGGEANIIATYSENNARKSATFPFRIKGTNPNWEAISNYITQRGYDSEIWFFTAIVRHESINNGGQFSDEDARMRFAGNRYFLIEGFPTFGPPDGYGLMQLDYSGAGDPENLDYIWNWKSNIDEGYRNIATKVRELNQSFLNVYNANKKGFDNGTIIPHADEEFGGVVYIHAPSNIGGFERVNNLIFNNGRTTDNTHKSFLDGSVIKYFNGKRNSDGTDTHFYYLLNGVWAVKDNVNGYVSLVSQRYIDGN